METAYDASVSALGGSAFLTQVRDGAIVPLVQFGGQASAYWPELASAYQESAAARACIEVVAADLAIHAGHPDAVASGYFAHGLDIVGWITHPETLPSAGYLASSAISQPLLFLTQIAHLLRVTDHSRDAEELVERASGFLGYSQGVMTAVCCATGWGKKGFVGHVVKFAQFFLWQGIRMQQGCPVEYLPDELLAQARARNEGTPTPMAALMGLTATEVDTLLDEVNALLPNGARIYRSLTNAWNRVVISGPIRSLLAVRETLGRRTAQWDKDPILRRRIEWQYVATSAPFHTPYMEAGLPAFRADLQRLGFRVEAGALSKPVYATDDGRNLQDADNVLQELLAMQWLNAVHWPQVVAAAVRTTRATHVVDFGPGDASVKLTGMNAEGRGIAIIGVAMPAGRKVLFTPEAEEIPWGTDWAQYRPQVVEVIGDAGRRTQDAGRKLWLDNKFARFTKMAPIFGGGMTPTSVETAIVTTAANAGYLVEWAGGGQVTEAIWRERLEEFRRDLQPGRGIIFNALFLDPYLWNLHYPKLIALKKEGYPIIGLTISAGIPDVDKATEILKDLNDAGIWMNAFKPGSDAMIAHFLQIADANPQYTLLMHVEGGKAGGHHSWEDIRGLMLRNYARIRRRKNVILCIGGGIATPTEAADWLMGTWQTNPDCPPMPVDAVFLGTRLMAVKEAKTSPQVKRLLVEVAGTPEWVRKLEVKGGVTSQLSQLGADVHFADNAAARAGALLDRLAGKSRASILGRKAEIVALLNATAKPYFGELPEMTYAAVLRRMVELMAPGKIPAHLPHDGPWFDATFRQRTWEWAKRIEERLWDTVTRDTWDNKTKQHVLYFVRELSQLDAPALFIRDLLSRYPLAETTPLHPEDVDYFLFLCRRPGKPVNFVPVIDEEVRRWYKADSLWQAHDPRYPADAVYTIPGPEAVRGIARVDEPVVEVLREFEDAVIAPLLGSRDLPHPSPPLTKGRELPLVSAVGMAPLTPRSAEMLPGGEATAKRQGDSTLWTLHCVYGVTNNERRTTNDDLSAAWREWIASQGAGPIAAFLQTPWIARGHLFIASIAARVCVPRRGETWHVTCRQGRVVELRLPAVRLVERAGGCQLEFRHQIAGTNRVVPLTLEFLYRPECGTAPIQEVEEGRTARIATFYAQVWNVRSTKHETRSTKKLSIGQIFRSETTVTRADIEAYCVATGESLQTYAHTHIRTQALIAPPNMTIVHAWGAFAQALMACGQLGSLLDLLHLSNAFTFHGDRPIGAGDRLAVALTVTHIEPRGNGVVVGVAGTLARDKTCVAELRSEFFIRNTMLRSPEVPKFRSATNDERRTTNDTVIPIPFPFDVATGEIAAPPSAAPYAVASRDTNPLHTDAHLAALAGFDGPIMHGMWSSAALLREVARTVGQGDPRRIAQIRAQFTQPVVPGDALTYAVRQVGNAHGARVFDATLATSRGVALAAQLHLREGRTAYLFTGQGSQIPGMGMEGYARSDAARAVWDEADTYCRARFGFSILHVVRENPRELLVRGDRLRHPQGVLHLTQFTQVALTVLAMAQVAELRAAGCYDEMAMYAGHSLGEYAALAATRILPLTELVSVVYHRGLTMQHFVPRDAHGVSPYGMAVVRPNIVGYSEERLQALVARLVKEEGGALEIVNFNIAGEQYSVTGETRLLQKMRAVLRAEEQQRGGTKASYIPLEGIDVPFHSTVLRNGVAAFRKTLEASVPQSIDASLLIGRYIPNLTATPFRLDRAYLQEVYTLTASPVVKGMLGKETSFVNRRSPSVTEDNGGRTTNDERRTTPSARALLIELLAYQFASPVQWIRTQAVLFDDPVHAVERVVEVGPQPVLVGMAKRTLARSVMRLRPPVVLHAEQDRKEVFYIREEVVEEEKGVASRQSSVASQIMVAGDRRLATGDVVQTSGSVLADEPLSVRDALWNLLALKLKLRPDEITESATIEKLSGGNSARRNEILADLGAEFNAGAIDDAQNKPLTELIALLGKKARYNAPGPYLRVSTDQAIKGQLPLSRKAIMEYLAGERLLPEGRVLAVMNLLPVATRAGDSLGLGTLSPVGLKERLSDPAAAHAWLDALADWYGSLKGVVIPRRGAGGSGGGAMVDAGALAALEAKYFGTNGPLARAAHELLAASGIDPYAPVLEDDAELLEANRRLELYTRELGPQFERVAAPLFDAQKILTFTGIWNWVRRDVVELYHNGVIGRSSFVDRLSSASVVNDERRFTNDAVAHIANAADAPTLDTIRYFHRRAVKEKRVELAKRFAALERDTARALHGPACLTPPSAIDATIRAAGEFKTLVPWLQDAAAKGLSLDGQRILVTGAGPGSIGSEIVANTLAAGARVVVTSTTTSPARTVWWRTLYADHSGRGAELHVLPASQGNRADMEAAVDWMVRQFGGIDACYPFGAVKESGDLTTMDAGASTATWRVLVQGVEWLIAHIARACAHHAAPGHRVAVVLPLSPNHGQFGGDGAYSESKAALEVLFNRWRSEQESWGQWVALMGPRIGWTRGTGLMSANDVIANAIEKETGCKTFSTQEMAFLLTALLHPKIKAMAAKQSLLIDYTGGFGKIPDIAKLTRRLREQQSPVASRQSPVKSWLPETGDRRPATQLKTSPHYFSFPRIPSAEEMATLQPLHHVDPKSVMVVVGYGEVSPFGSTRTRWLVESGQLTNDERRTTNDAITGWIELAWIMGLIRYEAEGQHVGWVDAQSGEPIADQDVKTRYDNTIVEHAGIRVCEPELQGFDPQQMRVWADVQLEEEFRVPVESRQHGDAIIAKYNGQAELVTNNERRTTNDGLFVRLKKGALIKVARASRFPRYIAGQIPTGWDATRYGIPKELVAQVDRNTLFNIVATVEAFVAAGIMPQELYDYFHPTRVGNSQGGGMGGMQALTHLYRAHREGQQRKGDALQETLINVVAAWVTQSFVGGYGPTVHPVGACATAVVSLDTAVNLLATNKADFIVAGGYDDYSSEGVIGFNDMEATANVDTMLAKGIAPKGVSRPNDQRRGGFVEAQGGGTLLVTRLDHAVKMGLPIYAVVGYVATHSDGIHTSIPAPGLGLLGMAAGGKDSPLAQALAKFGLTADDIAAVSKHDTSTNANDPNENQLHHLMQQALGRSPGNPLMVHSQKAWLGHAKGGAGAWQANAAIQMLLTGTVPGNPNLDDVDPAMAKYATMCFTDRALHLGDRQCRAVVFSSLGFGHVGAGALLIHPDYALRLLTAHELVTYTHARTKRETAYRQRAWEILLGKTPAYERRTEKPYRTTEEEVTALLQ